MINKERQWYLYKDTIHGIQAAATSKTMGWGLIRNECHKRTIEVPTMDKIVEVKELTWEEVATLMQNKKHNT